MPRGTAVCTVAIACAGACGTVLGVDDYRTQRPDAGAAEAGQVAAIHIPVAACDACLRERCPEQLGACGRDPACLAFANCRFGCDPSDGQCQYDCLEQHLGDETHAAAGALVACHLTACPTECTSCGTIYGGISGSCAQCAATDTGENGLCPLTTACLLDPECGGYIGCLAERCKRLGHSEPECRMACAVEHASGARQFYTTAGGRYFAFCREDCSAGRNWDCDTPVRWPPIAGPRSAPLTLHLPTTEPDASVPPVRVRMCSAEDFCTNPLGEGTTGVDGSITFDVDPYGPWLYFELYDPGSTLPTSLYHPVQPPVGDLSLWVPVIPVISPEALDAAAQTRGDERPDPQFGTVEVLVADCVGGIADGGWLETWITVEADTAPGAAYYGINASLEGGGFAAFINVPPGVTNVTVRKQGERIATVVTPVHPGATTVVTFHYPQWL